ncbi:MAG: nitroreductase/quinone reductase family protein [Sphaerobacter sp.]|nr:nitroreductase/quinone reductase family protein [Sphaerobacter sp.]
MATTKPAVEHKPPVFISRVMNPIMRRVLASRSGRMGESLLLLHFTGRKSGRAYTVPAGYHDLDDRLVVLTNSGWRHNFRSGRPGEVTLRGRRRRARFVLVDDPDRVAEAYRRLIERYGTARARRRLGIRFDPSRVPTLGELREAVVASGLSVIEVRLEGGTPTWPDV